MEGQIPHALPEFRNAMGSWRPDFLVDEGPQKEGSRQGESFCITEINARFSFNASMIASFGQQGLLDIGIGRLGLDGAADPAKVWHSPSVDNTSATLLTDDRLSKGYVACSAPTVLCTC